MHKKNYKNANNEISNNEKSGFFGIFSLGKPRVANLTPEIDSLRNFISIIYLQQFFSIDLNLSWQKMHKKVFVRRKWQRKVKQA